MLRRTVTSQQGSAPLRARRPRREQKPDPLPLRARLIWAAGGLVGAAILIWILRPVFAILAASMGLAYLLDPVVDWFQRRGASREGGIGAIFLGAFAVTLLGVLFLIPQLQDQVQEIQVRSADYLAHLDQHLAPIATFVKEKTGREIPLEVSSLQRQAPELVREYWPRLQGKVAAAASGLLTQGLGLVSAIVNLALLPIFLFYLLRDWDRIVAAIRELVPPRYKTRVFRVAAEVDSRLGAFVRGQITVAGIMAVLYTVGLLIVGIDLAVVVGVLSGILFVVPYLGTAVGVVLGVLLALVKFGFAWQVLGVLAVFGGVQLIEGSLLTPRIVGDSVGLHPLVVMIALIVGGSLLGIWGMLLAIPITAVLSVLAAEWLDLYRKSALFRASPGA